MTLLLSENFFFFISHVFFKVYSNIETFYASAKRDVAQKKKQKKTLHQKQLLSRTRSDHMAAGAPRRTLMLHALKQQLCHPEKLPRERGALVKHADDQKRGWRRLCSGAFLRAVGSVEACFLIRIDQGNWRVLHRRLERVRESAAIQTGSISTPTTLTSNFIRGMSTCERPGAVMGLIFRWETLAQRFRV